MGSVGRQSEKPTGDNAETKSLDELRAERKALAEDYVKFVEENTQDGFTDDKKVIDTMLDMQKKIDEVEYSIFEQLQPTVKEDKWKGAGITDLTREEAATVRQDMMRNKDIYMAIASAQHGVAYDGNTLDTAVDSLYKKNPDRFYNAFNATRDMLKQKYGDTMTLYRVPTSQTAKTTVNMTSTRANAEQYAKIYGGRVEAIQVPVKDVLAVNVSRSGGYEEFIILNRRAR